MSAVPIRASTVAYAQTPALMQLLQWTVMHARALLGMMVISAITTLMNAAPCPASIVANAPSQALTYRFLQTVITVHVLPGTRAARVQWT